MSEAGVEEPQPRGLYSGFERYTTPTDADYRAVLTSGLLVLDTNALLNLYRYTPRVRTALLGVLARVGDTLWEPDQVMQEFWHNREAAIRDYSAAAREFERAVADARDATIVAIRVLGNRIGLDNEHKTALARPIERTFADLGASVKSTMSDGGKGEPSRDTSSDPVLGALEPLLRGRVGVALDSSAHQAAVAEAKRRIESRIPPGYKDVSKGGDDRAAGDFIVWTQVLMEAAARGCDVLLVTGDVKEDWWRRSGGISSAGPRVELLDEFEARVGHRFFMLQPADFLVKAAAVFGVKVPADSLAQARQIDEDQTATSGKRAHQYVEDVLKALFRSKAQSLVRITDPQSLGVDAELYDNKQRVGVMIRYAPQGPFEWEWVSNGVEKALAAGYSKLLIITNEDMRHLNVYRLREAGATARFALWRSGEDDGALAFTVQEGLAAVFDG